MSAKQEAKSKANVERVNEKQTREGGGKRGQRREGAAHIYCLTSGTN